MGIDDDNDAAAAPAVAAVGSAVGHVLFAEKTARAGAAVTGSRDNADSIKKHTRGPGTDVPYEWVSAEG